MAWPITDSGEKLIYGLYITEQSRLIHGMKQTVYQFSLELVIGQAIRNGLIRTVSTVPIINKNSRSPNSTISSGYMTLHKDTISDLHIKVRSSISNPMLSYSFRSDRQWRLQQIQDAGNSIELASVYAQNGAKYAKKALRVVFKYPSFIPSFAFIYRTQLM